MGRTEPVQPEIRRIRRLLRETVRLAEHASLTGSLDKGSKIAIRQYNHIREHLQDIGAIPDSLFQELDEDEATFDELGIVCGMLEGYLVEEEEQPEPGGKSSPKLQVGMVGLKELEDLKEIGKVIREGLPDFLRAQIHGGPSGAIRIEIERAMEAAEEAREHAREAGREARQAERDARHAVREHARHGGREDSSSDSSRQALEIMELTNQIREVGERLRHAELESGQREELLQRLDQLMTTLQKVAMSAPSEQQDA
jgi:hypothetical protein